MAVNQDGVPMRNHLALACADERTLKFYLWYLKQTSPTLRPVTAAPALDHVGPNSNKQVLKNSISLYMDRLIHFHQIDLNQELTTKADENLLPLENFQWLKVDPEACYFVWVLMKIYGGKQPIQVIQEATESTFNQPFFNSVYSYTSPSELQLINEKASSHDERFRDLQIAFDHTTILTPLTTKHDVMESFKSAWQEAQKTKLLPWVNQRNQDSLDWTTQYIKNHNLGISKRRDGPVPIAFPIPLESALSPSNKEVSMAINTALRLWLAQPDHKTLFHQNINKAWRQRELRRTRTDKKAVNTYISKDAKSKLDALTRIYRMRMHEVLEILIEDEYKRHKN